MSDPAFDQAAFIASMREFQCQWSLWMQQCYPAELISDPKEANDRFAEEAVEAMQAMGMSKNEVLFMVNYVYSREKGEPAQEAAGTLSCLATLCNQRNIDLGQAAMKDLNYCWDNISQIREKNARKPSYAQSEPEMDIKPKAYLQDRPTPSDPKLRSTHLTPFGDESKGDLALYTLEQARVLLGIPSTVRETPPMTWNRANFDYYNAIALSPSSSLEQREEASQFFAKHLSVDVSNG